MTTKLSFRLRSLLCALATCHFVLPGNNLASLPPPSPIASMVAKPCLSLMNTSSCSATHIRKSSSSGPDGMATWQTRCRVGEVDPHSSDDTAELCVPVVTCVPLSYSPPL